MILIVRTAPAPSERHTRRSKPLSVAGFVRLMISKPLNVAVRLAAPEERRDDVATAVNKLMDAVTEELTVKQHAAYVVGLSVGRALQASASGELGRGWRARTP